MEKQTDRETDGQTDVYGRINAADRPTHATAVGVANYAKFPWQRSR